MAHSSHPAKNLPRKSPWHSTSKECEECVCIAPFNISVLRFRIMKFIKPWIFQMLMARPSCMLHGTPVSRKNQKLHVPRNCKQKSLGAMELQASVTRSNRVKNLRRSSDSPFTTCIHSPNLNSWGGPLSKRLKTPRTFLFANFAKDALARLRGSHLYSLGWFRDACA